MLELNYTWGNLLKLVVILATIWLVLYFVRELFRRTIWFGKSQSSLLRVVEVLVLLFEPITVLLVITTFVLINPIPHGLILVLVIAGGFPHFKNYLSGRIVRFDSKVKVDKKLKTKEISGIIYEKERLGLRLKTAKGLQFIGYSQLLNQGYMLLADEEIGGFYKLRIEPKTEEEKSVNHLHKLQNLLISAPYLDRNYRPEITQDGNLIEAQISVREKTHLTELSALIDERGYSCKVLKK